MSRVGSVSRDTPACGGQAGKLEACRNSLSGVALPAVLLLDLYDGPAALWSEDRSQCVFNSQLTAAIGYQSREIGADPALWFSRIEPRDCDRFRAFCQDLTGHDGPRTCRYRFLPARALHGIDLEERAVRLDPAGATPIVLSVYSIGGGSEGRPLIHKIGNHLQAIRGELDLLRLSGNVPDASAQTISRAVDAVHELVQQVRKYLS